MIINVIVFLKQKSFRNQSLMNRGIELEIKKAQFFQLSLYFIYMQKLSAQNRHILEMLLLQDHHQYLVEQIFR